MPSDSDPPILRATDLAELLGVTHQRAAQIIAMDGFPEPASAAGRSRLWRRGDVDDWIERESWWESKPWRKPPMDEASAGVDTN